MPYKNKQDLYVAQKRYRSRAKQRIQKKIATAYWAGIIDGEGCIQIIKVKRASERSKTPNHQLRLSMANTYKELAYEMQTFFKVGYVRKITTKGARKPAYLYVATPKSALEVLKQVLPYLIVKRQQAILGISFQLCKNKVNQKGKPFGRQKISKEELAFRDEFKRMMNKLNKRGH
jgi:hypothetical protein